MAADCSIHWLSLLSPISINLLVFDTFCSISASIFSLSLNPRQRWNTLIYHVERQPWRKKHNMWQHRRGRVPQVRPPIFANRNDFRGYRFPSTTFFDVRPSGFCGRTATSRAFPGGAFRFSRCAIIISRQCPVFNLQAPRWHRRALFAATPGTFAPNAANCAIGEGLRLRRQNNVRIH